MKKITAICLFVLAGVCLQAQTLSWEIKFTRGRARESVPIDKIIRMESGDSFQVTITPESDCFVYIVCQDSERQIIVLQNRPATEGNEIRLGPVKVEDPPGTETLYIIMSLERQVKLETLIQEYNRNRDSKQHANNLYREVVSLQNTASSLGEPASSFIASGGTTRGGGEENATRFSDKKLYVRAITIRH